MWCLATLDAEYLARMEDLLALYERPQNPAEPVVCLDEKPVSLHADVRAPRPARPGHAAKRDNEYRRCGTANIFGVVEPKAGRHFTCATPNRSAAAFARMVRRVIKAYPNARTIHQHGSWLNQAEIELSLVARQCLGAQRIPELRALQRQTRAWTTGANRRRTTITWRFTRKAARRKFAYKKPVSKRSRY
jgi:hypothetical protein